MAYTEFYAQTTGSNLNAGSSTADAALVTSANGNWDSATGIFICSGATDLSGVSVGMFASVYTDGASVGVYVGRITAVVDATDTITVSLTAKSGTAPSTSATGRTIKIGGAWKGPNGTEDFPFDFVEAVLTDASSNVPRVNFKDGTNYDITGAITHADVGPIRFQGYTATPGDGGRATIDGGVGAGSFTMLTLSGANTDLFDLILQNNGNSGSAGGLSASGGDCVIRNVVVNNVRGTGFNVTTVASALEQCEAYACNLSNTSGLGGYILSASGSNAWRCIAHDNAGSNSFGFRVSTNSTLDSCIADTNGNAGFDITAVTITPINGCVAYNNTDDGIQITAASAVGVLIENCILTKNGGFGINLSGAARNGTIRNCAFGAGTEVNTGGTTNALSGVSETGTISLTSNVDPFTAPTTGNFNPNNTAGGGALLRGLGIGTFTQTAASYTGTVGYPDVGAAQHQEVAAGGAHSYAFGA